MVGVFNQLSYGTICYNGMLSFYFLLTARFGYSNAYVSKVVELWMHIVRNGFAIITSVVALAIGAYGEMALGNGCWVAKCRFLGWLYFGLPAVVVFICLIINNSIIFIFVRRQNIPLGMTKQSFKRVLMIAVLRVRMKAGVQTWISAETSMWQMELLWQVTCETKKIRLS